MSNNLANDSCGLLKLITVQSDFVLQQVFMYEMAMMIVRQFFVETATKTRALQLNDPFLIQVKNSCHQALIKCASFFFAQCIHSTPQRFIK